MSNYVTAAKEPCGVNLASQSGRFVPMLPGMSIEGGPQKLVHQLPGMAVKDPLSLAVIIPLHHGKVRSVSIVVP